MDKPDTAGRIRIGPVASAASLEQINVKDSSPDSVTDPAFLAALEDGGSVRRETGWQPYHLVAKDGEQRAIGYIPLYLKSHSWGEYIFDWSWADAAKSFGVNYYPKLICMSPFTPITANKLHGSTTARSALIQGVRNICDEIGTSSAHILFINANEAQLFQQNGFFLRTTNQFHWDDERYGDFEGFLASFNHKHRKNVRQERRKVNDNGVRFSWKQGKEIDESDWDFFFSCYLATTNHYGAIPYIERQSYSLLGQRLGERVLLLIARINDRPIASAFFLQTDRGLCGRYWGALEYIPNLHFETCYYQPIEYCLNHGIRHFEAGAQGEHKIWRGLKPTTIYSAHYASDPAFHRAIRRHSQMENDYHQSYKQSALAHSPYKKTLENEL